MTKLILASKNAQFSLLATVGIVAISAYFWSFTLDDSFVTYRYAENLVHSGQLTWNVGEDPVEGATSFLWVMVSAVSVLFSIPPADFTQIVSVLAIFSVVVMPSSSSSVFF